MQPDVRYQITQAGWQDLNDLRRLEDVCFREDSWPLWDLIAVLTLPKVVRLKAVVDRKMVGFIAGDPHTNEQIGWIATLGVLPSFRRMGIANALLELCEQEMSLPRVRLCVRRDNDSAIALYLKTGYRMIDTWKNYYQSGQDALVMEKIRR